MENIRNDSLTYVLHHILGYLRDTFPRTVLRLLPGLGVLIVHAIRLAEHPRHIRDRGLLGCMGMMTRSLEYLTRIVVKVDSVKVGIYDFTDDSARQNVHVRGMRPEELQSLSQGCPSSVTT